MNSLTFNAPLFIIHLLFIFFFTPGWYEGIRLSDGQKGWFPDANVIEITNEHVRRRNIKERYRVSHATRMLKNVKAH